MSCARELSIIFNQLPLLRSYWWKMAVLHYMLRLWSLAILQGYTQLSLPRVIHNSLCPGLYTTLFAQGYTQLSSSRSIYDSVCPRLCTAFFVYGYILLLSHGYIQLLYPGLCDFSSPGYIQLFLLKGYIQLF